MQTELPPSEIVFLGFSIENNLRYINIRLQQCCLISYHKTANVKQDHQQTRINTRCSIASNL